MPKRISNGARILNVFQLYEGLFRNMSILHADLMKSREIRVLQFYTKWFCGFSSVTTSVLSLKQRKHCYGRDVISSLVSFSSWAHRELYFPFYLQLDTAMCPVLVNPIWVQWCMALPKLVPKSPFQTSVEFSFCPHLVAECSNYCGWLQAGLRGELNHKIEAIWKYISHPHGSLCEWETDFHCVPPWDFGVVCSRHNYLTHLSGGKMK